MLYSAGITVGLMHASATWMVYVVYAVAFSTAAALSLFLTWSVRNFALAHGWVSRPLSERHVHIRPIPRIGGVAIYLCFTVCAALFVAITSTAGMPNHAGLLELGSLLLPATLILAVGIYDDFVNARPWVKLMAQVAAGVLLYVSGFHVTIGVWGMHSLGWAWSLAATVFWTVLVSNAFNLIDGLDGLAAGSALFSAFAMFVVSLVTGNATVALLSAILAGSIVGFLRYNFNPATIFLGDSGSLFLGFMLAAMSLAGVKQQKSSTLLAVAIPVVAFGLPILETAISVVRRFLSGQPIFNADRDHIHHKLLARGLSQRKAVVLLYAISAIFAALSLLLLTPGTAPIAVVFVIIGVGLVIGVQHLRYHEFFELSRIARRTLEQKQVIMNNLLIRRGAERLWRAGTFEDICAILENTFDGNDFEEFTFWLSHGSKRLVHEWRRDAHTAGAPTWSLALHIGNDLEARGELVLRRSRPGALLLDMNLLALELSPALNTATERLIERRTYGQEVSSQLLVK